VRERYLITGGAGFVGSHLVAELLARDADCIVLDDLSTGHAEAVLPGARLIEGNLADTSLVNRVMADGPWAAVFHFASLSIVGDSMREPLRYLNENVGCGINLIEACIRHGVKRFVLSSTAALFGSDVSGPIDEDSPIAPSSPYGDSKWLLERALQWADEAHGLRGACLRYFNAAGCDPDGRLGEDHEPETHLIPIAVDAALGRRPGIAVFGRDYPTPDGTCIRDYVHVNDLAEAHVRVLAPLERASVRYNLGTGRGYSVLEIVRAVERIAGKKIALHDAPRRPGDPASLVASSSRIVRETGWAPRFSSLERLIETTLNWRAAHPRGFKS
jgi:UDP-glucose 4-epimerase